MRRENKARLVMTLLLFPFGITVHKLMTADFPYHVLAAVIFIATALASVELVFEFYVRREKRT